MNSKKNIDWVLLITILIVVLFGLMMVYSSSYPEGYYKFGGNGFLFLRKQLYAVAVGIFLLVLGSQIKYTVYKHLNVLILAISLAAFVFVTFFGLEAHGAQRWIQIGPLTLQPSDIIKMSGIMFMAYYLEKNNERVNDFFNGYIKTMLWISFFTGIIIMQRDLSTGFVVGATLMAMFIISNVNIIYIIMTMIAGISMIGLIILREPYRIKRVISFIDPFKYKLSFGWQAVQSLYALGTGGMFGAGLGESRQKFFYIPEPYNDFIFSVIGEEMGFFISAAIILLYAIIIWRGIRIAINIDDMFGAYLAVGITSLIGIQTIVHVAVVTSSMPPTGIGLPFISAGGTSLVIFLFAAGVLLNISKHT